MTIVVFSEITAQELIDLIGNQEENLWIDFKKMEYHKDSIDPDITQTRDMQEMLQRWLTLRVVIF